MPGVGKLLKQAQKMQSEMEALQEKLAQQEIEVSTGGGAIVMKINGCQEIRSIHLDPDFLKEEKSFIEETLVTALQEAIAKSKALNSEAMESISSRFDMPGLGLGI